MDKVIYLKYLSISNIKVNGATALMLAAGFPLKNHSVVGNQAVHVCTTEQTKVKKHKHVFNCGSVPLADGCSWKGRHVIAFRVYDTLSYKTNSGANSRMEGQCFQCLATTLLASKCTGSFNSVNRYLDNSMFISIGLAELPLCLSLIGCV